MSKDRKEYTMKPCPGNVPCGETSPDDARFCIVCGASFQVEIPAAAHMHTTTLLVMPAGVATFTDRRHRYSWLRFNPSLLALAALALSIGITLFTAASRVPATIYTLYEAKPLESVFVVKGDEYMAAPFQTEAFWSERAIASTRVTVPYARSGPALGRHVYEPEYRVFVVDRWPASVGWGQQFSGPDAADTGFDLQSSDGRTFSLSAACNGTVEPADAAKFLHYFAGSDIEAIRDINHADLTPSVFKAASVHGVLNRNVRQFFASRLAATFLQMQIAEIEKNPYDVVKNVAAEATDYFSARGLQLHSCGQIGGIVMQSHP